MLALLPHSLNWMRRIFPIALLLLWSATGIPAMAAGKGAGPRSGKITRLEISFTNRADLTRLTQAGYDVDSVKGQTAVLFADDAELQSLRAEGWTLKVSAPPAPAPERGPRALGEYNNSTNVAAMLDSYATNYPSICRKVSLGKSVQNRELWALKITSNPDVEADKPEFRYVATMHGNEPIGTEMCLYLIDLLLKGYGSNDTRIVSLVNNVEIWIVPLMNPDGRDSNPPQRYNATGFDLNRSFPEGAGNNLGNWLYGPNMNTNGLQPEVRWLMAWTAAHNFVLGANFHSGALVANYPYDNDSLGSVYSIAPDDALFQALARAYSSNNAPMWNSPFFTDGIVNGAEWYAITGGMQDWNYRWDGCLELTMELADYQWPDPPASELATYWSQNQESMLAYLEWVLRGVRGILRDAQTGQPVKGAVRVEGIHHLIFSDADIGDYHRLLLPGTYTLWFYAPGYVPQRIPNVVVGGGPATRVDVALQPVSARFAAKINFQPAVATLPLAHLADSGAAFGARGGGYSYGWETTLPSGNLIRRQSGRSQDLRYDTLCQMQAGGNHVWEIALPNGPYSVLVAAGDSSFSTGLYRIQAENITLLNAAPSSTARWVEGLATVVVTDGRLTLSSGAGAVSNRLGFVEISALEPATVAEWRALNFATTNNLGVAANDADPDNDRIPNLLEYAFGLNPNSFDPVSQLTPVLVHTNGADWFGCEFPRNTNAADLSFAVQGAGTITSPSWFNLAARTNGAGWFGPGLTWESTFSSNRVKVTALDSSPIPTGTNRLLRLRVTGP